MGCSGSKEPDGVVKGGAHMTIADLAKIEVAQHPAVGVTVIDQSSFFALLNLAGQSGAQACHLDIRKPAEYKERNLQCSKNPWRTVVYSVEFSFDELTEKKLKNWFETELQAPGKIVLIIAHGP
eukprot:Trichotokara_eunicae@DN11026_c0_g1_i1.p1